MLKCLFPGGSSIFYLLKIQDVLVREVLFRAHIVTKNSFIVVFTIRDMSSALADLKLLGYHIVNLF